MRVATWFGAAAVVLVACTAACGSKSSPVAPSGVGPRITSLVPGQIIQNDAAQTITVDGLNFVSGLTATLTDPNGVTRTFVGDIHNFQSTSFQITTTFASAGSYTLQVANQTGNASDPFSFSVQSKVGGTAPQISDISPSSALHNSNAQFLTINGAQFSPSLTVTLLDPTGQPTQLIGAIVGVVTPTQFQVLVTLSRVGTYTLFVTNPTGEVSNSVSIAVL